MPILQIVFSNFDLKIFNILLISMAVISNTALIYLLFKRPVKYAYTFSFIFFLFLINFWGLPKIIINSGFFNYNLYVHLDKISSFGYIFIPSVFIYFTFSFIGKIRLLAKPIPGMAVFLVPFIFLFLSWNTNLIEKRGQADIVNNSWGYESPAGDFFGIFLVWFETLMVISMLMLHKLYKTSLDPIKKRQSLWIFVAVFIPLLVGTITDGVFPLFGRHVFPMAIPLTSIMALIVGYAIYKFDLFEPSPNNILSSIGDGVITINTDRKITFINRSAKTILKIKNSLIGSTFDKAIYFTDQFRNKKPILNSPVTEVINTIKQLKSDQYCLSYKNRKPIPVSVTLNPIKTNQQLIGASITFKDISYEKELEKNKDDFISIASHELRTPLTSLQLFNQLLLKDLEKKKDNKLQNYSIQIQNQLGRLTKLTTDLLDTSRISTNGLSYYKKQFDLNQLIKETIENLQQANLGQKIVYEFGADSKVYGDKERIAQVLINLITNALKYSHSSKKIIVKTKIQNNYTKISVQDFGRGIKKSMQSKIFQRYFRNIEDPSQSGFGLGLYISSQIISNHQGKMWVESKIDRGSTFYFTLPTA